jgi:hypothetical protein
VKVPEYISNLIRDESFQEEIKGLMKGVDMLVENYFKVVNMYLLKKQYL